MMQVEMVEGKRGGRTATASTNAKTGEKLAEDSQKLIIQVSMEALAEEQRSGFTKKPITKVDNKFGKPVRSVNAFGKVAFYSPADLSRVVPDIYARILRLSTIGHTHQYVEHHLVVFNGKVVARSLSSAIAWSKTVNSKRGDNLYFVNTVAYARSLELNANRKLLSGSSKGQTNKKRIHSIGRKGSIVRNPNGAYKLTETYAKSKHSEIGFIDFRFLLPTEIGVPSSDLVGRTTFAETGRPYTYPALRIKILG